MWLLYDVAHRAFIQKDSMYLPVERHGRENAAIAARTCKTPFYRQFMMSFPSLVADSGLAISIVMWIIMLIKSII